MALQGVVGLLPEAYDLVSLIGAPGEIRTPDPQIRSLVLYSPPRSQFHRWGYHARRNTGSGSDLRSLTG